MLRLTPPTARAFVSSAWGNDRSYRGGWHEGLDFPAGAGELVLAAAPGKVIHVDNVDSSFAGKWVAIDHGGIVSRYLHNARNDVKRGQTVSRGQPIGIAGASGTKSGRIHVHFDIKASDQALAEHKQRFGVPTTGFGRKGSMGTGVPSEPYMSRATYNPKAKALSAGRGVVFYKTPWLMYAAIAGGAYWLYTELS